MGVFWASPGFRKSAISSACVHYKALVELLCEAESRMQPTMYKIKRKGASSSGRSNARKIHCFARSLTFSCLCTEGLLSILVRDKTPNFILPTSEFGLSGVVFIGFDRQDGKGIGF